MRRMPTRALAAAVLLFASACGDNASLPPPAASPTAAATPTPTPFPPTPTLTPDTRRFRERGPFGTGVTTVRFEDPTRPTMANGTFPGAPTRTLVTEIWYPTEDPRAAGGSEVRDAAVAAAGAPFPLVVHSHGFSSNRSEPAYLGRHLSSHGYVVIAPDFPLTNLATPGGPNLLDVVQQPRDVSFLIDRMLEKSASAGDAFEGAIDPSRIALTGLSLGGMTTYLTTFHPDLRDPRVRVAAPFAGPACFFDETFFGTVTVPLLIVFGDLDAIVPYPENGVHAFAAARPPKYLATLLRGSHTGFADIAATLLEEATNPDELGCATLTGTGVTEGDESDTTLLDILGGPAAGVVAGDCPRACTAQPPLPRSMRPSRQHELTIMAVHAFLETYLNGDDEARSFLQTVLPAEAADLELQFELP